MEPFAIEITRITYTVRPTEEDTFRIYEGEAFIAELQPELDQNGAMEWLVLNNDIPADFATQIGELIEEYDM